MTTYDHVCHLQLEAGQPENKAKEERIIMSRCITSCLNTYHSTANPKNGILLMKGNLEVNSILFCTSEFKAIPCCLFFRVLTIHRQRQPPLQ